MTERMLIAGVGNIFLADDGFGIEVVRRLASMELPDWVTVADYGISGMHLAYDLASGFQAAILIDAAPRGGTPGTVYVIEPERQRQHAAAAPGGSLASTALFDAHGMQPDVVFGVLDMLGAQTGRVLIVGCEPATADYGIGLSAPVAAAVDQAVRVVLDLIAADGGREATAAEQLGAERLNGAGPGDGRPSIADSGEGRQIQARPGEDQ